MKKIFLVLSIVTLLGVNAKAQSGIGIRGGASFFNFGGEDVSENDYTNRAGFHAGIYASILGAGPVSIEPGVYYSVKGTQNDDIANTRAILDYVDVPVLLRLKFGEGFNVFAGPQVSFLTNSRFEGDFGGSTLSLDTDSIKDTDAGLVFGLGYNLPKGLNIQGSYDYGMTPLFKNSDADVYNRGFKVSLGYTF
ncbi:porin family protein [Algoriphagus boritolerans]|uniref:Outer membrane protein beta-barrel domain-containing protein n=1 Tax=Algoriphagus boritolerans DSM 17298 = JCM 18970 TaxID=1120964 RepID=A0A1H6A1R9_9BACT|nr:porin family protein [Algoriphagus boritolerans]SEG41995.1 Outer membrane protein beta-barrel domain-containing protein [Algoriphagus boritolerans DSM 17298 = JCM 18970]